MKKLCCIVAVLILLSLFTVNCFAAEPIKTETTPALGYYIPGELPENVYHGTEQDGEYTVKTNENVTFNVIPPESEDVTGFAVLAIVDENGDDYKWMASKLPEDTATAAPFYMFFIDSQGNYNDLPNGTIVDITALETQYVVGLSPNGVVTKPAFTYKNGMITFRADGSKFYVLCEKKAAPQPTPTPEPTPEQKPESVVPNTGDNANVEIWFGIMAISGLAIALLTVYKKKKS